MKNKKLSVEKVKNDSENDYQRSLWINPEISKKKI